MSHRLANLVFQCKDPALGSNDRLVLQTIAFIVEEKPGGAKYYAKKADLAHECQIGERTAVACCASLVSKGFLIEVEKPVAAPTVYAINEERLNCHLRKEWRAERIAGLQNPQACNIGRAEESAGLQVLQTEGAEAADQGCENCSPGLQNLQTYQEVDLEEIYKGHQEESAPAHKPSPLPVEDFPLDEWEIIGGVSYPEPLRDPTFVELWRAWMKIKADAGYAIPPWTIQQNMVDLAKEGLERATVILSKAVGGPFKFLKFEVADEEESRKTKSLAHDLDELQRQAVAIVVDSGCDSEVTVAMIGAFVVMLRANLFLAGTKLLTPGDFASMAGQYATAWGELDAEFVAKTASWYLENGTRYFPAAPDFVRTGRDIWKESRGPMTVTIADSVQPEEPKVELTDEERARRRAIAAERSPLKRREARLT